MRTFQERLTYNLLTCQQVNILLVSKSIERGGNTMAKLITAIRIRKDRAEALREKSIELTMKKKEIIKEADIVNYLIDECLENLDIDDLGMEIKE